MYKFCRPFAAQNIPKRAILTTKRQAPEINRECILFPSYAFKNPDDSNSWIVRVKGWALTMKKPGPKQILLKGITRSVAGRSSTDHESNQTFDHRFKYFLAYGKKDSEFKVQAVGPDESTLQDTTAVHKENVNTSGGEVKTHSTLVKSESNGVFGGKLYLADEQIRNWIQRSDDSTIRIKAEATNHSHLWGYGAAQLIEPKGISVISDIDDTIKDTRVLSGAREVLLNTFFNPTRATEGMADLYRFWYKFGAAFHYVSSSPIQLTYVIENFIRNHQFPPGSFHLRPSSSILSKIMERSKKSKYESICAILKDFPQRKFILIGDSSEIDLEIYTQISREHPGQIIHIFIRDVTTCVKKQPKKKTINSTFFTSNISLNSKSSTLVEDNYIEQESISSSFSSITRGDNEDSVQEAATELAGLVLETSLTGHHIGDTIHSLKEGQLTLQDLTSDTAVLPILQLRLKIEEAQKHVKGTSIKLFNNGRDLYNNSNVLEELKSYYNTTH